MVAEHLAAGLLAWLGTYALHSTLLLGLAWTLSAALARSSRLANALPLVRESIWRVALLAGIVTASAQRALELDAARVWTIDAPQIVLDAGSDATHTPSKPSELADGAALPAAKTAARGAHDGRRASDRKERPASTSRAPHADGATPSSMPSGASASSAPRSAPITNGASATDPVDAGPSSVPALARTSELTATPVVMGNITPPDADDASASWTIAALGVWIAGVVVGGARWLREWLSLRRTLRRRVQLDRGFASDVFASLCQRSGTRGVRLSCAAGLSTPITIGILRHEIILPPRATTQLASDELEAMLAHELAHARRDDPLWLVIYRALEVVLFFQPLNRVARVRLQDEAELLADDWAATQVPERVALASCLTEIAGWIVHDRQRLLAPAMAARGSRLSQRVHRLLDDEHHPERARRPHGLLLLAGLAVTGVALFGPGVAAQSRASVRAPSVESATAPLVPAVAPTPAPPLWETSMLTPSPLLGRVAPPAALAPLTARGDSPAPAVLAPTHPLTYVVVAPPLETTPLVARALESRRAFDATGERILRLYAPSTGAARAQPGLLYGNQLDLLPASTADGEDEVAVEDELVALEREIDVLRQSAAHREVSKCLAKQIEQLSSDVAALREQRDALLGLLRQLEAVKAYGAAGATLP